MKVGGHVRVLLHVDFDAMGRSNNKAFTDERREFKLVQFLHPC
jgi:hypothetical protein